MRLNATLITCMLGFTMAVVPASNAFAKRSACRDDAKTFCADVQRGDRHAMHQCLMEHQDELSDACVARIENGRQHAQACRADVETLCPDITPGDRRSAFQCLSEHDSELSESCRAVFRNHGPSKGS